MQHIDAAAMAKVVDYVDLVDWLRDAHREDVDAMDDLLMTQPAQGDGEDTLLIRAAWQRGRTIGIKLVTVFPNNTLESKLPAIQALYTLFGAGNGALLATLDGTELTFWKTAADSALGADLLARDDCTELLVVGAGPQARHMILAHTAVRPSIRRVNIWNRTVAKAQALADSRPVAGLEFACVTDLEAATRSADIISTATASEAPLVLGEWLEPGQHLDLVGGYKPQMVETNANALTRSRVFVDARETTIGICGDFTQPIARGEFRVEDVEGDLFDLCRTGLGSARERDDITLFKNGGGGHLDLMTANYFSQRVRDAAG